MNTLTLSISEHVTARDYGKAYRALCMSETLRHGLAIANQGNAYWSRRDAMQALALFHNNQRSA